MTNVELIRLYTNQEHGTLGILKVDKVPFCVTLEPSDRFNVVGESSIPLGQYICKPYGSTRYRDVYQVRDVPGRTKILFHPGNVAKDTDGCILLGEYFSKLTGVRAVINSGKTFDRFRKAIGREPFHLTIISCY